VPDRGGHGQDALVDAGGDAAQGACAVVFEAELAFQRIDDGFDALADRGEVAVPAGFVAAVRAHEGQVQVAGLAVELGAGEAFVTDHDSLGRDPVVVAGLFEQFRGDLAFAEFRVGQGPGDRHAVQSGEQVQLQAPVPAGV
jgi:hypothetical protein